MTNEVALLFTFISFGTIFTSIVGYLLVKLNNDQTERAEKAAKNVLEVKETLANTAKVGADKMDTLAKEDTLKEFKEISHIETIKLDDLTRVAQASYSLLKSTICNET